MKTLLLISILSLTAPRPAVAEHNLVVIVVDQLSHWVTDPAQRAPLDLPCMDALAAHGTTFSNCYTTSPVCSANRLALLAGQYPFALGTNKLQVGVPSLGTMLDAAGWDTGYVGKWHLSPSLGPTGYVQPANRPGWRYFAGNEGAPHNYLTGVAYRQNQTAQISMAPWAPTWNTGEALRFIRAGRAKPFAMVINYGPPHPAAGPQGYIPPQQLYTPAEITLRPNVPAQWAADAEQRIADYMGLTVTMDTELGVLLAEINLATTFVVLTADHGDMLYSHGGPAAKRRPWEEASHIPLIIAGPGIAAGVTDDRAMSTVDILPSILSLLDVPIPNQIQGQAFPSSKPVYFGHDSASKSWKSERWRALVHQGLKYAVTESGFEVLHDLQADPYEMVDLSVSAPATLQAMRVLIEDRATAIGDPFFGGE